MRILVAYATKHGATRGIAARIAERLRGAGLDAQAQPVKAAGHLSRYDAFVIGSAAYLGHWLKEAVEFVLDNRAALSGRPVWLFSSGPLGTEQTDAQGRDQRSAAEPKEIAELRDAIHPRDHHVFFGALDPATLGFRDRAIRTLPAGRAILPEGDFRDWREIDAWAEAIAGELTPTAGVPAAATPTS
jgi:menaquinone-dependent protoporphyrinogen oxidase